MNTQIVSEITFTIAKPARMFSAIRPSLYVALLLELVVYHTARVLDMMASARGPTLNIREVVFPTGVELIPAVG